MKLNEIKQLHEEHEFITDPKEIMYWMGHNVKNFRISNWIIDEDGTTNYNGDVSLINNGFDKLPIKFGVVSAFDCGENPLTTLIGCPFSVNGTFNCAETQISSFEGIPDHCRRIVAQRLDNITKIEDIFPHIKCNLHMLSMEGGAYLKTLEGIGDLCKHEITNYTFNLTKNFKAPVLGLLQIPGLRYFGYDVYTQHYTGKRWEDTCYVLNLVQEYLNRKGNIFELQSRLIDEGYEDYAQL